jgi:hypothetical protein
MVQLADGVLIDAATDDEERARMAGALTAARGRLAEVYGPLQSAMPAVILCKSRLCQTYYAGSARRSRFLAKGRSAAGGSFVAERATIVVVRVDPRAARVVLHELVHVELNVRQGHGGAPAWFHEGLAASLSDEPPCAGPPRQAVVDLHDLDDERAWNDFTNRPGLLEPTYCQARAEVEAWIAGHGVARVLLLFDALRAGRRFYEIYGPMLTR